MIFTSKKVRLIFLLNFHNKLCQKNRSSNS
nr:MAG TPA: hypothetical protein [Caudoviricetes sp.]